MVVILFFSDDVVEVICKEVLILNDLVVVVNYNSDG